LELETKKSAREKKNKNDKFDATKKVNMISNVIIEDLFDKDGDALFITSDAFEAHFQDMQITKIDVIHFYRQSVID
jgi:hypothetical protein